MRQPSGKVKRFAVITIVIILLVIGVAYLQHLRKSESDQRQSDQATVNSRTPIVTQTTENVGAITTTKTHDGPIFKYLSMPKDEILSELGNSYKIIPTGAEGACEGYYYENLGLTFIFDTDKSVDWIDCDESVNIEGAREGMNFEQIQKLLGTAKIEETFIETPEFKAYEITYVKENAIICFLSMNKDGNNSDLYLRNNKPR